ncbi:putative ankyrin repeat protein [Beauveria bassiana]|nr:putative ankyrin repeat protein [Beauveria bassiana]
MDAVHSYLRYIPRLRLDLIRRQIQIPDTAARTALHLAAERIDNDDVIDLLLSHGPDVNLKDNKGRTALHLAAAQFSNMKAIDLLLQHHLGINLQDEQGQTALHLAADTRNNIKNIESLVNAGVNTNLQDLKGRTALHLAAGKEHNETVIDFLLLSGAHINTLDNEQRPSLPNSENRLREAIENDQKDITEALLDGGVDGVSGRPGYGQKALGFSVARGVPGKEMAFWLLLRKGVGVNTAKGHKALLLASDWWEKWDKANYALRASLSPSDPSKELSELLWKVNLGMEVEGETIIYRLLAERKYPRVLWALLRTDDRSTRACVAPWCRGLKDHQDAYFHKSLNAGTISLVLPTKGIEIIRQQKTAAILIRGAPFPLVAAVSGRTGSRGNEFRAPEAGFQMLDEGYWGASENFVVAKELGSTFSEDRRDGAERPGSFYASHAEAQLMCFFVKRNYLFRPLEEEEEEEEDEDERMGVQVDFLQLFLLQPRNKSAKIVVSQTPCFQIFECRKN